MQSENPLSQDELAYILSRCDDESTYTAGLVKRLLQEHKERGEQLELRTKQMASRSLDLACAQDGLRQKQEQIAEQQAEIESLRGSVACADDFLSYETAKMMPVIEAARQVIGESGIVWTSAHRKLMEAVMAYDKALAAFDGEGEDGDA